MESKLIKNIFYFVGLSLKRPSKGFFDHCLALWSHVAYALLILFVIVMTLQELNLDHQIDDDLLRTVTVWVVQITAVIFLVNVAMHRRREVKFWDLHFQFAKVNRVFVVSKFSVNWSAFRFRVMFVMMIVPTFRIFLSSLWKIENRNISIASRLMLHLIIIHGTSLKLIHFLNILEAHLMQLKNLLCHQIVPPEGFTCLKKLYAICWKMNKSIEEQFSLQVLLISAIVVVGTIYNSFMLFVSFNKQEMKMNAVLGMSAAVIELCLLAESSDKCHQNYRLIQGFAQRFDKKFEPNSLELQLLHQKIVFSPKKIYSVGHSFLVEVSCFRMQ